MEPSPRKLRVGLLLTRMEVSSWAAYLVDRIEASDFAEILVVVVDSSPPSPPRPSIRQQVLRSPLAVASQFARRLLESFDAWFLERKPQTPDAFAKVDLSQRLPNVVRIDVQPIRTKWSDRFSADECAAIRAQNLDVLIRIGFRILRGDVLTTAHSGVWSFHHGDNSVNRGGPPCYWEAMERWPVTGCTLQVLSEDLDNGFVLARTWSATVHDSVTDNRNSNYWKSLSLVVRQLRDLHAKGTEQFFADHRRERPHPAFYSRRLYRPPILRELFPLVALRFLRWVRNAIVYRLWFDQWILMFSLNEQINSSLWRYRRLVPPVDRFWADPFVVHRSDRYFIFFEELVYAEGNAHVAVIEIDAKGNASPARTVLRTPQHVSYPSVFEHAGDTWMLLESRATRSVPLYRCTQFPDQWQFVMNLMDGVVAVDPTLHLHEGRWWLFVNMVENPGAPSYDELFLFYADDFRTNNWTAHPLNPIVSDARCARPAGRLFTRNGYLYRPSQDCSGRYGYGMNLNVVEVLNTAQYSERVVTRIEPSWAPDVVSVHTFNTVDELHVVDAQVRRRRFRLRP
jgi:hypothetical protein